MTGGAALLTLAGDVLVAASRKRTLWYYLLAATAIAGALVLGADLAVVVRRVEPAGPLPRTVSLGRPLVPGSVAVEAGDPVTRGHLALDDDGSGHLVEAGGAAPRGTIDYARGVVTIAPDVASVESLVVTSSTSLVGLAADDRERLLDAGHATHLTLFGQSAGEDAARPPRLGAAFMLRLWIFGGLLVWVFAAFFGVLLGVLATSDAVSSALEPGAVELLLSRPVRRVDVVAGRFLGGLAFGALQLGWLLGLSVVLVGLKFGQWLPIVFAAAPIVLLKFAVLLAIATCAGVLTRTNVLGLAAAAVAWVVSFALNQVTVDEGPLAATVASARRLVPQVSQLDIVASFAQGTTTDVTTQGAAVIAGLALAWVLAPLALTTWVVSRRDL